jgi:hypothetical protein
MAASNTNQDANTADHKCSGKCSPVVTPVLFRISLPNSLFFSVDLEEESPIYGAEENE